MNGVARQGEGRTITYTDLLRQVTAMSLAPHDYAVAHLLGEISQDDFEHGKGMRSALVVSKEDAQPGSGFFALARQLGEPVDDEIAFWLTQLKRVHEDWGT